MSGNKIATTEANAIKKVRIEDVYCCAQEDPCDEAKYITVKCEQYFAADREDIKVGLAAGFTVIFSGKEQYISPCSDGLRDNSPSTGLARCTLVAIGEECPFHLVGAAYKAEYKYDNELNWVKGVDSKSDVHGWVRPGVVGDWDIIVVRGRKYRLTALLTDEEGNKIDEFSVEGPVSGETEKNYPPNLSQASFLELDEYINGSRWEIEKKELDEKHFEFVVQNIKASNKWQNSPTIIELREWVHKNTRCLGATKKACEIATKGLVFIDSMKDNILSGNQLFKGLFDLSDSQKEFSSLSDLETDYEEETNAFEKDESSHTDYLWANSVEFTTRIGGGESDETKSKVAISVINIAFANYCEQIHKLKFSYPGSYIGRSNKLKLPTRKFGLNH